MLADHMRLQRFGYKLAVNPARGAAVCPAHGVALNSPVGDDPHQTHLLLAFDAFAENGWFGLCVVDYFNICNFHGSPRCIDAFFHGYVVVIGCRS